MTVHFFFLYVEHVNFGLVVHSFLFTFLHSLLHLYRNLQLGFLGSTEYTVDRHWLEIFGDDTILLPEPFHRVTRFEF